MKEKEKKLNFKKILLSFSALILIAGAIACYWFFSNYALIRCLHFSVEKQLGEQQYYKIKDLEQVTELLYIGFFNKDAFDEMKFFPNVTSMEMSTGLFEGLDLGSLKNADKMVTIHIWGMDQKDFRAISGLKNLKTLYYGDWNDPFRENIVSLDGLDRLSLLEKAWIYDAGLMDISALGSLKNLKELKLGFSPANDFSVLGGINSIKNLDIYWQTCYDVDFSFVGKMTQLEKLAISGNSKLVIPPLDHLVHLRELDFSGGYISDISPLGSLPALEYLNLDDNEIVDISSLSRMKSLKTLNISRNHITDIDSLFELNNLTKLIIHDNPIKDQKKLQELMRLVEERAQKAAEAKESSTKD